MEIRNHPALERAARKYPQVAAWLESWVDVVAELTWHSILDVRVNFPHADGVPLRKGGKIVIVVTCFNAGGNDFRLLTTIDYGNQIVVVLDVLTHAEYSKNRWKRRLL